MSDPVVRNLALLQALRTAHPQLFTEVASTENPEQLEVRIDFEALRSELGAAAETAERFGLSWPGRREAIRLANQKPSGSLVPVPDKSLHFDEARNVFIEGENLEVLRTLKRAYAGSFDAIYIDPLYNTGKDMVYRDSSKDPVGAYLRATGQVNEKGELTTVNDDADGRFHSNWLTSIYPRLVLARDMLTDKGVLFASIDENERAHLEIVGKQIFPQFLGEIIWDKRSQKGGTNAISTSHEHILVFANAGFEGFKDLPKPNAEAMHKKARELVKRIGKKSMDDDLLTSLKDLLQLSKTDLVKKYPELSVEYTADRAQCDFGRWLARSGIPEAEAAYSTIEVSTDGKVRLYQATSLAKPDDKGYRYDIPHPDTGLPCAMPDNGWRMPEYSYRDWHAANEIIYGKDHTTQPRRKLFLDENMTERVRSVFVLSKGGATDLRELGGLDKYFDYPKPQALLEHLLSLLPDNARILDFYAGSGSTAHAVMALNAKAGSRTCISVQWPEKLKKPFGALASIADLSAERVRRAHAQVCPGKPAEGFRYFRLDKGPLSQNTIWESPTAAQLSLLVDEAAQPLRPSYPQAALPWHLLQKAGLPLTTKILPIEGLEGCWATEKTALGSVAIVTKHLDAAQAHALVDMTPNVVLLLPAQFNGHDSVLKNLILQCETSGISVITVED